MSVANGSTRCYPNDCLEGDRFPRPSYSQQASDDVQTEGSFKRKRNEILDCSMDIERNDDEQHPFDEMKGKRSATSSLSCLETLSAKR